MGRQFVVIALLPALLLPLAIGCSREAGGQFHSYQPSNKLGQGDTADPAAPAPGATVKADGAAPAPTQAIASQPAEKQSPSVAATSSAPAKSDSKIATTPPSKTPSGPVLPVAGSAKAAPAAPRKVTLLVPERKFRPEGDGALRVSYDDLDLLKVLNMEPVTGDAPTYFPGWLKSLDGRRIRIRGFMYPTFQQTGVHAFGLARDNQICCFGRSPKIYDVFDVVLREGTTTNYIPGRPFDVVGVFHIRPEVEDGKLFRLYEMDDATVVTK